MTDNILSINGQEFTYSWQFNEHDINFVSINGNGAHSIYGLPKTQDTVYHIIIGLLNDRLEHRQIEITGFDLDDAKEVVRIVRNIEYAPLPKTQRVISRGYTEQAVGPAILNACQNSSGTYLPASLSVTLDFDIIGHDVDQESFDIVKDFVENDLKKIKETAVVKYVITPARNVD